MDFPQYPGGSRASIGPTGKTAGRNGSHSRAPTRHVYVHSDRVERQTPTADTDGRHQEGGAVEVTLLTASALGVLIGLVLGALGGGGGVLTVPVLVYALGRDPAGRDYR